MMMMMINYAGDDNCIYEDDGYDENEDEDDCNFENDDGPAPIIETRLCDCISSDIVLRTSTIIITNFNISILNLNQYGYENLNQ